MIPSGHWSSQRARGVVFVAAAGVLWSTLGIGVRLMEAATAWQIIFYRALFQTAAVTGLVAWRYRRAPGLGEAFRRIGWPGLSGAVALGVAYNSMIVALTLTSVATVVFILGAAPLVTGLLARGMLGEPLSRTTAAASACALAGIALTTLGAPAGAVRGLGALAAGVTVLGYAGFTLALRSSRDVDMLPTVALSGVVAAALSAPMIGSFALAPRDLALTAYLGGVSLTIGLALYTAGSRHLTSAELPLLAMTESVLAPLWVWIALGESVAAISLLGGGIVLGAVGVQGWLGASDAGDRIESSA